MGFREYLNEGKMKNLLNKYKGEIKITSGEGEKGYDEIYTGKRTERAIKSMLTKERSGGDRWARAVVFSHDNETSVTGIDLESGEYSDY